MFEASRKLTAVREPLRGRLIASRYRLEKVLGEGGMGTVYRATDLELDATVAVKFLKDRHMHPRSIRRFVREGKTGGKLCHPHIVKILDAGDDDGPYLVMEYVDGVDIRRWWKQGRRTVGALLGRFEETLKALDYAHKHGVIHRDIKPENIFVNADGRVKVMDFGLAQDISSTKSSLTSTGAILGTAAYMSPEQAAARATDTRTDLYSLGVVMYELLTGRLPFRGNPISVLMAHLKRAPAGVRELNPDVDENVEQYVHCLLEKEPERRFPSARKALEALQEIRSWLEDRSRDEAAPAKPSRRHAMFDDADIHSSSDELKAPRGKSDELKTRELALVAFEVYGLAESLSELSPLEALRLQEDYRTRIRQNCALSGATVVEFSGWLATAIYDQACQPQPGEKALHSVLQMADQIRTWVGGLPLRGRPRTSIAAGVFSEIITTNPSVESLREASLAPTTQACRRLLSMAAAGSQVLANDRAALQVGQGITAVPFREMCLAGRARPVRIYKVAWDR